MATTTKGRRKETTGPAESGSAPVATDPGPDAPGAAAGPEPTATPAPTPAPAPAPAAGNGQNGARDRMKVTMVGEILDEHPDGIPAADLVTFSEFQPTVVARVLTAMEAAGAAYRKVADSGAETWYRGSADLGAVDLAAAPTDSVCPTCKRGGWRVNVGGARPRRSGGNGEPRVNADGNAALRKGELTGMVRDFLRDRPDEDFTEGEIARQLAEIHNRPSISAGAVRENLHRLLGKEIRLANPDDPHDRRVRWGTA